MKKEQEEINKYKERGASEKKKFFCLSKFSAPFAWTFQNGVWGKTRETPYSLPAFLCYHEGMEGEMGWEREKKTAQGTNPFPFRAS